ncbi:hypothetical protein [Candidatus Thioglobus sp.]|uniref:hypothetical protein n=1 Tax=Candidatus Thioglobus sp. TaxID=2026721 RepID=UPI003D12DDBC
MYKLLNRNLLALDINPNAIALTKVALDFEGEFNPTIKVESNILKSFENIVPIIKNIANSGNGPFLQQ